MFFVRRRGALRVLRVINKPQASWQSSVFRSTGRQVFRFSVILGICYLHTFAYFFLTSNCTHQQYNNMISTIEQLDNRSLKKFRHALQTRANYLFPLSFQERGQG